MLCGTITRIKQQLSAARRAIVLPLSGRIFFWAERRFNMTMNINANANVASYLYATFVDSIGVSVSGLSFFDFPVI